MPFESSRNTTSTGYNMFLYLGQFVKMAANMADFMQKYVRYLSIRGPGAEPRWGLGAKPPEAERLFHFQKVIVA
jgi:hypothetical protein